MLRANYDELAIPAPSVIGGAKRILIEQPNEDVRDLLAEHCRRMGMEPIFREGEMEKGLPDIDMIVAEPASPGSQCLLSALEAQGRKVPIVFASIYPPTGGITTSPAVAYLVLPCARQRFEQTVAQALKISGSRHL